MPNFMLTFTLREERERRPPRVTSGDARKALNEALAAEGFKSYAADRKGNLRRLTHSARVGAFASEQAAVQAVSRIMKAVAKRFEGDFFLEASTLSQYAPLLTNGDAPPPSLIKEEQEAELQGRLNAILEGLDEP